MTRFFLSSCIMLLLSVPLMAQGPLVIQVGYAPLPNVTTNAGVDSTICVGQSIQLNATGNGGLGVLSYSWQPTTGLSNPNIANPTANPTQTTTYTLTTTDNRGCFDTDALTITVVTCASVGENHKFGLQLYPNPATSSFQIRWDADKKVEQVRLKDLQGRLIQQIQQPEGNSLQVFSAELAKGLYFVEVDFTTTSITEKLILQ
ncbi:MAG: T9SS type A sorting domain-containing protein [Sphingobacteriaceae bacterium]|nr:T9SS type A sorting domain-containing protein [Sphingobacteriaceae bacterium]